MRHPLHNVNRPPEDHVSAQDAQRLLNVSRSQVDALRVQGRLKSIKISGRRWYCRTSIDACIESVVETETSAETETKPKATSTTTTKRGTSLAPRKPKAAQTGVIPSVLSERATGIIQRTRAARVQIDALIEGVTA